MPGSSDKDAIVPRAPRFTDDMPAVGTVHLDDRRAAEIKRKLDEFPATASPGIDRLERRLVALDVDIAFRFDALFAELRAWAKRVDEQDRRIDAQDARQDATDQRIDNIEQRLAALERARAEQGNSALGADKKGS